MIERVEVALRPPNMELDRYVKTDGSEVLRIPHLPAGGLPAATYHALPIPQILRVAKQVLHELDEDERQQLGYVRDLIDAPRRRGPGGRRDAELARIAELYVQMLGRGSRRPVADVATVLAMNSSQVRDALHRARSRGLLSGSSRGVAGGTLSEQALAILASDRSARRG